MKNFFCFCVVIFSGILTGQTQDIEMSIQVSKKYEQYLDSLKTARIDNILILKQGHYYQDNFVENIDQEINRENIYVLTQYNGEFTLAEIDSLCNLKTYILDTCSIFKFIDSSKMELYGQRKFYEKYFHARGDKRFLMPAIWPVHYLAESIQIQLSDFKYYEGLLIKDFNVINKTNEYPQLGTETEFFSNIQLKNEKWFSVTKEIIKRFSLIIKVAKNK